MRTFKFVSFAMMVVLIGLSGVRAEWEIMRIDYQAETGKYTAIGIDSNDYPHIAYQDDSGPRLKYAYYNGTGWVFEYPVTTSATGYDVSMVLDGNDRARILHYDDTLHEGVLTYRESGGTWETFSVALDPYYGRRGSIDLDDLDRTAVSYDGGGANKVVAGVGWSIPGTWTYYDVADGDIGCTAVQTRDLNLYPLHLAFSDYGTRSMKVARSNAPQWTIITLESDVDVGNCAMQLDNDDYEHVMYITDTGKLQYAAHSNSGWTIETIASDAGPFLRSLSYTRTASGDNHVCYRNTDDTLTYATDRTGSWVLEVVDPDAAAGSYCSLALDSNENVHISYYDTDKKDLKYARRIPPPTPTPTAAAVTYDLEMEDVFYTAGETFRLDRTWTNTTSGSVQVDEYILLDILQMYWFWPTWGMTADFSKWTVPVGGPTTDTILTFVWPDVEGEFTGIRFWGAFLASGTTNLLDYDMIEWGYGDTPPPLTLTSTAFANGAAIPADYTCDGTDVSPDLAWTQPTQSIQSYALIVDDPDAPGGTWTHWVIYNIPATAQGLAEAVPDDPTLPDGTMQGKNSWNTDGYRGPCPPSGGAHRYFFTLYALDSAPALAAGATKQQLLDAMTGHILYQAVLMGTYQR